MKEGISHNLGEIYKIGSCAFQAFDSRPYLPQCACG